MNERILSPQLLKLVQAAGPGYSLANPEWVKKFAELIVRECVIRAEREWIRNGSDTEHNQAVSKVIESIKQHFGVEE